MQINRFRLTSLPLFLLLAAACTVPGPAPQPVPANCCEVPWGFEAPADWSKLSACYFDCGTGGEQSPINIVNPRQEKLPAVDFTWGALPGLKSKNWGYYIRIDIPEVTTTGKLPFLVLGGETYWLKQFHFHIPSEHKIRGNDRPIEMHFVNVSPGGRVVAIGVFIKDGTSNSELAKIWKDLPKNKGDVVDVGELDLGKLLPPGRTSFRYAGSLTNPPCNQGFQWIVYHDAIDLAQGEIEKLRAIFSGAKFPDGNRRPVQELNGRVVVTDVARP